MQEGSRKRRLGVGLMTVSLALIALVAGAQLGAATDPTGGATSTLLAQGGTHLTTSIRSVEGTDVVVAQNTFPPGASSGWHSHPGVAVIVVQSGEITLYRKALGGGPCRTHTYEAGDTFFEWRRDAQNGVNTGSTTTVVYATFFKVPHGGSARIDRPDPGNCPK